MSSKWLSIQRALLLGTLIMAASEAVGQLPSPLLLVLDRVQNRLQFVDPVAKKVLGALPTGNTPHEVTVSSDGKLAFVSVPNDGNILVFDVAEQKELRRLNIGARSRLHGMVYAGSKLYFTAEGFRLIGRYDPASDKIDWFYGTGQNKTHLLVISKDLNRIFTSNVESNTLLAIDDVAKGPPSWKSTVIPVGKSPEGIAWSPDEKEIWSASWDDSGLSIIDVATKKVIQTLDTHTKHINRLAFTPDGKLVLLTDLMGGDFLVYDAATRKEIKRLRLGSKPPEALMILRDGSRAYIGGEDVTVFDLKTLEVTGHIPTHTAAAMAWVETK
jgi:YVTN family beta-propeller protein